MTVTVYFLNRWMIARKNTIKTLALVAACFIICWSWNQIYYFMFNLGITLDFSSDFFHFTVIMVSCNPCINPFIYMIQYSKFKMAAKQLFFRKKKEGIGENSSEPGSHNKTGLSIVSKNYSMNT